MSGEDLKALRRQKGLTQQQLGELLGYKGRSAEVTVQRWEHDRAPIPMVKIKPLAQILGCDVKDLLP